MSTGGAEADYGKALKGLRKSAHTTASQEKVKVQMQVLYLSSMFEQEDLAQTFDHPGKVPHAANKFNRLLCEGIALNGVAVRALALLPITRANCNKVFVKGRKKRAGNPEWRYLSTVNIPVVKHVCRMIDVFFKVLFAPKGTAVFFDLLAISANLGMTVAAKLRGFQRICIVTDLPEQLSHRKSSLALHRFVSRNATGYLLLTEQMSEQINPARKKEVVVEGVVDMQAGRQPEEAQEGRRARKILYAGSLHKIYGVDRLIEAFLACRKEQEELHLYGDGDYAEEIRRIAAKEPSVLYHGSRPNDEILIAERQATLLVNPRTGEGEYTKYSFPSKVLEYMSSGTPVLMAKLPGIPEAYGQYCYLFDDRARDGLAHSLRQVLDMDEERLKDMGRRAMEFVLTEKNNMVQARKALDAFQMV